MTKHLVAAVVGALGLVLSQPAEAQTTQWGVKGGLNVADNPNLTADFEDEGAVDLRSRYGLIIGGFASAPLLDWLAFQTEVLYTQKGMHGRNPFSADEFEFRFDYVDVPLLARLHRTSRGGVYGVVGPSVNFNIGSKLVSEGDEGERDFKDDTEGVEVGLVVGAGLQWPRLLVEGRWIEGLTSVSKSDDSYHNRSFALLVGVRFP